MPESKFKPGDRVKIGPGSPNYYLSTGVLIRIVTYDVKDLRWEVKLDLTGNMVYVRESTLETLE